MTAMDMVRIPAEALAEARLTRLVALECFRQEPLDIEELRPRFLDQLRKREAHTVIFGPQSYSLDSFIDDQVACGLLNSDPESKKYVLTERGDREIQNLERLLHLQSA